MPDPVEVLPTLHLLPARPAGYTGFFPPNVWLVHDGEEGVLVDSGFGDEESVAERLRQLREGFPRVRVRWVVLTHVHMDHSGGAHRFREELSARIAMHRLEEAGVREAADTPEEDLDVPPQLRHLSSAVALATPDRLLDDGDLVEAGAVRLRAVHTPGHRLGHNCYLYEFGGKRVLFTGDHIVGAGTVAVSPPPAGSMSRYMESLALVLSLEADLLCPGHGPVVPEPRAFVERLVAHRRMREAQVLRYVREGRDELERLLRAIYPEIDKRLWPFARGQVRSHLAKLEEEGRIRVERADGVERALPTG